MPTYQRTHVHTSDDIRAIADHAGSFFFSPGTMKFWDSRLLSHIWTPDGPEAREGARFVFLTSDRGMSTEPRTYAVRVMTLLSVRDDRPSVDFATVGRHDSISAARMAAQLYVAALDQQGEN